MTKIDICLEYFVIYRILFEKYILKLSYNNYIFYYIEEHRMHRKHNRPHQTYKILLVLFTCVGK